MDIREFLIERYYAKYEFSTPYMLSSSDAESFQVKEVLSPEEQEMLLGLHLGYTESQGDPELRKIISDLYEADSESVIVYAGAEEGVFCFMAGVLKEGDHMVVQFPCYQSLHEIARANGVDISYWRMEEENGWRPDTQKLRELITERTRAVLVNTPHNPTGYHMSREELEEVVEICRGREIYLFSDEVYRFGEHKVEDRLPSASDLYKRAVALGVLSKPFGLPGIRIGWTVCRDAEVNRRMQAFKDYTTICSSAPSELIAKAALRRKEDLLQRNMEIIRGNLALLDEFMESFADLVEWVRPRAGTIGFVRTKFTDDVEAFCLDLIEKKGVLLLPSTTYEHGSSHFRIGFGRSNFPEALNLLGEFLEKLRNQ